MIQTAFVPGARRGVKRGAIVIACPLCRGLGSCQVGASFEDCTTCDRRGVLTFRALAAITKVDRSTIARLVCRGKTACRPATAAKLLEGLSSAGLI